MKICLLGDASSVHIMRWVNYLASKNYEVHLISLNSCRLNTNKFYFYKVGFGFGKLDYILAVPKLKILLKHINPDLVHAHYATGYGFLGLATGFHPFILSVWGSDLLISPKESFLYYQLIKKVLYSADYITTTSRHMYREVTSYLDLSEKPITTFSWGIELDLFSSPDKRLEKKLRREVQIMRDQICILSPRVFKKHCQHEVLIKALPRIIENYSNIKVVFLVDSSNSRYAKNLQELVDELNVGNSVSFIKRKLTLQEMATLYSIGDILISIPKSDQLSSTLLEGMYCGLIPIVTNLDPYKEVITSSVNGIILKHFTEATLAKAIIQAIEMPKGEKEDIRKVNKKIIKLFHNWERQAQVMERIYKNEMKKCERLN